MVWASCVWVVAGRIYLSLMLIVSFLKEVWVFESLSKRCPILALLSSTTASQLVSIFHGRCLGILSHPSLQSCLGDLLDWLWTSCGWQHGFNHGIRAFLLVIKGVGSTNVCGGRKSWHVRGVLRLILRSHVLCHFLALTCYHIVLHVRGGSCHLSVGALLVPDVDAGWLLLVILV